MRHRQVPHAPVRGFDAVLALESRRFGQSPASPAGPLPIRPGGAPGLVIDLTGSAERGDVPILTLDFNGRRSFAEGMTQILATGRLPELIARLDGVPVGRARPMMSDRLWLTRAGTDVLAGAVSLIEQSVSRFEAGQLLPLGDLPPVEGRAVGGFLRHHLPNLGAALFNRARQKLTTRRRPFYWQVGYRQLDGPGVAETGGLDGVPFTVLPDDGKRFYADPFAFEREGRQFVFVEEFPYATGRGVIAVAELGADGKLSTPQVIIEEPHHLSYPQVFALGGEVWMIPESSEARELVLYRATEFPHRWVREATLLSMALGDATLLEQDGRFWLFATERRGEGSFSDTMSVFVADTLRGPYAPHPLNPVIIDRAAARPGGAFVSHNGKLFLPVQDGTTSYGGGLGLAELLELDGSIVRFAKPQPVRPAPDGLNRQIHTLNRVGRLEVVDWSA